MNPINNGYKTSILGGLLCGVALVAAVILWASMRTGSPASGIRFLMGDHLRAVVDGPLDFTKIKRANGNAGSPATATVGIEFLNLTDQPVRIVGYNNPCLCVQISELPIDVPPNGATSVVATMDKGAASAKQPSVVVAFLTDLGEQGVVRVRIPVVTSIE